MGAVLDYPDTEDLAQYKTVSRWLGRRSESSRRAILHNLRGFFKWIREKDPVLGAMNPDELIEFQQNATSNGDRHKILDAVQDFINSHKTLRYKTKVTYYANLRSFFVHNRAELPNDKSFMSTLSSDVPQVMGGLDPGEIRNIILASKPRIRAVLLSILQGGMDRSSWDYWNRTGWPDLKEALDKGETPIRVKLPGRKKKRFKQEFYTFIGKDAIDAIKQYRDHHRPNEEDQKYIKEGKIPPIFFDQYKRPLSKESLRFYYSRVIKRIGLVDPITGVSPEERGKIRYGKNIHEFRDTFRTLWGKSRADPAAAEFMMGHGVDPLGYNKMMRDIDFARKEYRKAEPMLNIMSSDRPYGKVDEDEIEVLRAENEELRRRVDALSTIENDVAFLMRELKEMKAEREA